MSGNIELQGYSPNKVLHIAVLYLRWFIVPVAHIRQGIHNASARQIWLEGFGLFDDEPPVEEQQCHKTLNCVRLLQTELIKGVCVCALTLWPLKFWFCSLLCNLHSRIYFVDGYPLIGGGSIKDLLSN